MALRELLAEFGIEVDTKQLEHAHEKVEAFVEGVGKVAKAVGAAFAIKEVFEFAEGVAHAIHQVSATAAQLGIETDTVQEYAYAANAAGMSSEMLLNSMGRLQVSAAKAAAGGKEASEAFSKLHVSVKGANGEIKPADQLLDDVAEGVSKITDPAKQAAYAVALLGRGGRQLLPFLKRGSEGMREMRAEFKALGGGFDEEAIEKSEEFEHSMAKIKVVVDGIKGAIVKGLFPVLGWLADKAAAIGGWFVRMTKNTNAVRNALILLGVALSPLAIQMAIAFAPILLAAAAATALYLAFDDIVTLFEGGQSVIGDQIDKIFGKGQSAKVVESIKQAWTDVKDVVKELAPYVEKVVNSLKDAESWVAKQAGEAGDWAARYDIKQYEESGESTHLINGKGVSRGIGGHTYEGNAIRRQATLKTEADANGQPFHPTEVPAAYKDKQDEYMQRIATFAARLERGEVVLPGQYGPLNSATGTGDNINVNIAGSTGMKEHEVKRAVADGISEARQRRNRDAKHVVSQAGQKP